MTQSAQHTARGRSLPSKESFSRPSVAGMMHAAESPWIIRHLSFKASLGAPRFGLKGLGPSRPPKAKCLGQIGKPTTP